MLNRNGPHPEIPGKALQDFPTQDITDCEVVEQIDCLPQDYQPLAPETAHPDNARTGLSLILVGQGPSRLQSDPPKMERVYMTLPGAWTTDTRIDPDGATVTIRKRKQLNRLILTTESVAGGIWTRVTNGPGGDAIVGDEIEEVRPVLNNGGHVSSLPSYSIEIPERSIPQKLRAALPTNTTETILAGTASMPTLQTGDLYRKQQQIDSTAYRLIVTNLPLSSLPISVSDHSITEQYGGGPTTITWTLSSSTLTIDEGLLILNSKADALGNGLYLKTTETRDGSAWPVLAEAKFTPRFQTVTPSTKQVVLKDSTTPGVSNGVVTEVQKIDYVREERIITTQPLSAVDAYVRVIYGNNTSVDVPPQLDSLTGYIDLAGGAGNYSENGGYSLGGSAYGGGNIQLRGSAQASASAIPELGWVVRIPRTRNIPCIHVLLYVANGTSRANIITAVNTALGSPGLSDWPNFRPEPITVLMVGGKVSIQTHASVSAHDSLTTDYLGVMKFNGNSRHSGSGLSFDVSRNSRVLHIPETIHGALSILGDSTLTTQSYASSATINGGVAGATVALSVGCFATGTIGIVSSTSATTGLPSIPTSGLYVHRMVVEPDPEVPRMRVFAEVVDFADIKP